MTSLLRLYASTSPTSNPSPEGRAENYLKSPIPPRGKKPVLSLSMEGWGIGGGR